MFHGMHHIAGAGLALGADHGRAFAGAPQRLAQIARPANERNGEGMLIDVVGFIGGGEHFGFVNVIHAQLLQNLRLGEVTDTALGHHRNGDSLHDLADFLRRGHASHAALGANLRRYPLQRHHGSRPRLLGDGGLLGVGDVHDHPALDHFGQAGLQPQIVGSVGSRHTCTSKPRARPAASAIGRGVVVGDSLFYYADLARRCRKWRANIRSGSMAINTARPRASTSPCWLRISATFMCIRPRTRRSWPSAISIWPSGTGLRYSISIALVSATTERSLFTLPMASSRTVAMMPP